MGELGVWEKQECGRSSSVGSVEEIGVLEVWEK